MNLRIHKATATLARNQVAAAVLCLLMVVEALSVITINHKWTAFEANMTQVFEGNFTEVTTPDITVCALLAARSPANLACHKSSRCVFASVYPPRVGGEQTEGFTCWYFPVCSHEGKLLRKNENVTVADPACLGNRTLTCSTLGMIFADVPPPRTSCTAPFTQHSFGCMYDSQEFYGTYCEARRYCQELGADLASPETVEDTADMRVYYDTKHAKKASHYIGLYRVNGVWRWPANQRDPGPPRTGDWSDLEPNDDVDAAAMYLSLGGKYLIGDASRSRKMKVLCHVWTTY